MQAMYDNQEPYTALDLFLMEEGIDEDEYYLKLVETYTLWEDEDVC